MNKGKINLLILALILAGEAKAQESVKGFYSGEFISSINALSLTQKDTTLSGIFYKNEYEGLDFKGFYSKNILRAVLVLEQQAHVVTGRLAHDTLYLELLSATDGSVIRQGLLTKVSKNPNYDVSRAFSSLSKEHDLRLMGRWLVVKTLNGKGENVLKNKYIVVYHKSGTITVESAELDRLYQGLPNSVPRPELLWETKGNKLITRFRTPLTTIPGYPSPPSEFIRTYSFKGDTLLISNPKTTEYLIKN